MIHYDVVDILKVDCIVGSRCPVIDHGDTHQSVHGHRRTIVSSRPLIPWDIKSCRISFKSEISPRPRSDCAGVVWIARPSPTRVNLTVIDDD